MLFWFEMRINSKWRISDWVTLFTNSFIFGVNFIPIRVEQNSIYELFFFLYEMIDFDIYMNIGVTTCKIDETYNGYGWVASKAFELEPRKNVQNGGDRGLHAGHHCVQAEQDHHDKEEDRPQGRRLDRGHSVRKHDEAQALSGLNHLLDLLACGVRQVTDVGEHHEPGEDRGQAVAHAHKDRVSCLPIRQLEKIKLSNLRWNCMQLI